MTILTASDMRQLEEAAVDSGLDYLRLMENAGSAAAREIRTAYPIKGRAVTVLCGRGNNGGDGFVIARKLLEEGACVTVVLVAGLPTTAQAKEMYARITPTDIAIHNLETEPYLAAEAVQNAGLLVDAVYGIGFRGELPDYVRHLFRLVNQGKAPVVSVDIPSGLSADSGEYDPDAIRAARTVTFTAMKPGLFAVRAADIYGEVTVAAIGIDQALVEQFTPGQIAIDTGMVAACFPKREPDSHKGTYGHVLCVGGSYGMAGAVTLCTKAALRCGAGLVTAAVPDSIYPLVAAGIPEAVFLPLPGASPAARIALRAKAETVSAVVLGCGIGTEEAAQERVADVIAHGTCPLVLDADGINCAALHIDMLKTGNRPLILTPHPGEMARLAGCTVEQVQRNRARVARSFAEQYGVTLVLKGHETLIAAPHRALLVNTTGNPGMATGGSGDVLAGMIGALLAQGMEPYQAAMCAVHLHGLAGDRAAERLSQHAMLPTDLLNELGDLFLILEK